MSNERAPLLSDEWIEDGAEAGAVLTQLYHEDGRRDIWKDGYRIAMKRVRDLITKGELRVAVSITDKEDGACSGCGYLFYIDDTGPRKFCPECGGKYTEP